MTTSNDTPVSDAIETVLTATMRIYLHLGGDIKVSDPLESDSCLLEENQKYINTFRALTSVLQLTALCAVEKPQYIHHYHSDNSAYIANALITAQFDTVTKKYSIFLENGDDDGGFIWHMLNSGVPISGGFSREDVQESCRRFFTLCEDIAPFLYSCAEVYDNIDEQMAQLEALDTSEE